MTAVPPSDAFPLRFVAVVFGAAVVIGIVIAYFGIHGALGAGIP